MEERKKNRLAKERFYKIYRTAIAIMLILTLIAISIITIDYRCKVNALESEVVYQEAPVIQQVTAITQKRVTVQERELIERVVMAEARGESLQGQMAVAQTILDRSTLWNMTITEVVTAPNQYAEPYKGEISEGVRLSVSNVFDLGYRIIEEPVTHFYSGTVEPYWASNKIDRGWIGKQRFMY